MEDNQLVVQSLDLAVKIIGLAKELKNAKEYNMSDQIGRSGTSVGANIKEAQFAISRADFIAKMQIALNESNETSYWLELLKRTGYITVDKYKEIENLNVSIRTMLIATLKTSKKAISS